MECGRAWARTTNSFCGPRRTKQEIRTTEISRYGHALLNPIQEFVVRLNRPDATIVISHATGRTNTTGGQNVRVGPFPPHLTSRGREDLNLRPLEPHSSALPGCATPRDLCKV